MGAMLLITALVISLLPISGVEASSTSDFQMEGTKLVKYNGTAEVVSVPDGVRSIGEEAFAGNSNIVKVTINDKCKEIGYGAFRNCVGLHSVVIGPGVEEIGSAAFSNDRALKSFSLGSSVKKLGSAVFAGDTGLSEFTVDAGNKFFVLLDNVLYDDDIERVYFMLPSYRNGEYEMPSTVNEIVGYAFWGNNAIKNVSLSSNLVSVPGYAFSNCPNLRQVNIPLPIRSIDAKAFEDCVNLSLVNCPDSMTQISDSAFDGCPNVTINATKGSYAYNFGQNLKKTPVDEIEYEDVEDSAIVSAEIVSNELPELDDDEEVEVVNAKNEDSDVNSGEESDDNSYSLNLSGESSSVISENKDRYYDGVISGYNVLGYNSYDPSTDTTENLMGASGVVSGRALIFIENSNRVRAGGNSANDVVTTISSDNSGNPVETIIDLNSSNGSNEGEESIGDIIVEEASKGLNFPKFTLVGDRIASQAYYKDSGLTEYDFPEGVNVIGDFAFARSGLKKIDIPDGVTTIGYGAFYHCDELEDVDIPNSVTSIEGYAFDKTAFVENYPDDFVIVGDGILIGYKGADSIVTIPEGVKLIADGAFRDHLGITAVNLATTMEVIGENAFSGCGNLSTVNRGENVKTIGANAFKGCSLTNVTIYPSLETVGLGSFDLENGTDTVSFIGNEIPKLVSGTDAKRLSNDEDRSYAFGNIKKAIVPSEVNNLSGTVLEPGTYGFQGVVVDEFGNTISDNTNGASTREGGLILDINSSFIDPHSTTATIAGDEGTYILHMNDSQNSKESISLAYSELFGGRKPDNLLGFEFDLRDSSDTVNISKLGKQFVEISMVVPSGLEKDMLNVVCLDEDGQLEAVDYTLNDDQSVITLRCKHFSPYGMFNMNFNGEVSKTGDRIKDDTPDTGDFGMNPKWFLAIGLFAVSILLFIISGKRTKNINK